MKIGTFRRNVGKTLTPKPIKLALKTVAKNATRAQIAQSVVGLKVGTGQLLQAMHQYVLGLPQTEEMKSNAFKVLGDVGYSLTALAKVLKVKLPSSTKKAKLVGTRGAALLNLDSMATELLELVQQGAFKAPKMTTITKLVSMPQKGGAKEERQVVVVDAEADKAAEAERQHAMKSYLSHATDLYWRLCFDMTQQPPVAALLDKAARMKKEYPGVTFDLPAKSKPFPKAQPKAAVKPKAKKAS